MQSLCYINENVDIFRLTSDYHFSCSLMSLSLKGGNKTVINTGKYGDTYPVSIVVLHRECGSSGNIG